MSIHHMSLGVADLDRAVAFYDRVLAPLGLGREVMFAEPTGTRSAGYGRPGQWALEDNVPFWLEERSGAVIACPPGFHIAFDAIDADAVHAFHAAGLAAGGLDNGPPGPRPAYGPAYYAAFLIDPDGWRIEAVTYNIA